MNTLKWSCTWRLACVTMLLGAVSQAAAVEIVPDRDIWVRETNDSGLEDDGLHVSLGVAAADAGAARTILLQYNLSGLPAITSARMQFAASPDGNPAPGAAQHGFSASGSIAGLNYSGYLANIATNGSPLENLGRFTVPAAGVVNDVYVDGPAASAADLAALNAVRTGSGQLTVVLKGNDRSGLIVWHDGANVGGGGRFQDQPIRLVLNEGPAPAPGGNLYRVDFEDDNNGALYFGNEPLAAAASSRFDDPDGLWTNPSVPHHAGGGGGITGFERTLLDRNGAFPITWRHLAGDAVRANDPSGVGDMHGSFWFFSAGTSVDWEITGLLPNSVYEMFHYGGWPPGTPDAERIVVQLDTDGDGLLDLAQEAGLATGGLDGVYFSSIATDGDGRILGRWETPAGVPSFGDTAGFQLALVSTIPEPSTMILPMMALTGMIAIGGRRRRVATCRAATGK